jgi:hypothetical protein
MTGAVSEQRQSGHRGRDYRGDAKVAASRLPNIDAHQADDSPEKLRRLFVPVSESLLGGYQEIGDWFGC